MAKLAGFLKIYSHMEMSMSNLSSKVWRLHCRWRKRERKSCQPGIEMRPLGHLPTYIRHTHVCLRSLFTHTFTLSNHINISFNSQKNSFSSPSTFCNQRLATRRWPIHQLFFFFFSRPLTICNLHSMPIYLPGISMCSRTALLMHLLPLRHIR